MNTEPRGICHKCGRLYGLSWVGSMCPSCQEDTMPKQSYEIVPITTELQEAMLDARHAIRQGWECPRCLSVNAPWIDRCQCKPKEGTPA